MSTQLGDVFYRPWFDDHWMIIGIKVWEPDVYQFQIWNLERGQEEIYTAPFGDSLPDIFEKVG